MAHGLRRIGEVTDLGTIEAVSLTAYQIGGAWVPFPKVDGPYSFVEPLVVLDPYATHRPLSYDGRTGRWDGGR